MYSVYTVTVWCKKFWIPDKIIVCILAIWQRNLLRTMSTTLNTVFIVSQFESHALNKFLHSIQKMFWILLRVPKRQLWAKCQHNYAVLRALTSQWFGKIYVEQNHITLVFNVSTFLIYCDSKRQGIVIFYTRQWLFQANEYFGVPWRLYNGPFKSLYVKYWNRKISRIYVDVDFRQSDGLLNCKKLF